METDLAKTLGLCYAYEICILSLSLTVEVAVVRM